MYGTASHNLRDYSSGGHLSYNLHTLTHSVRERSSDRSRFIQAWIWKSIGSSKGTWAFVNGNCVVQYCCMSLMIRNISGAESIILHVCAVTSWNTHALTYFQDLTSSDVETAHIGAGHFHSRSGESFDAYSLRWFVIWIGINERKTVLATMKKMPLYCLLKLHIPVLCKQKMYPYCYIGISKKLLKAGVLGLHFPSSAHNKQLASTQTLVVTSQASSCSAKPSLSSSL